MDSEKLDRMISLLERIDDKLERLTEPPATALKAPQFEVVPPPVIVSKPKPESVLHPSFRDPEPEPEPLPVVDERPKPESVLHPSFRDGEPGAEASSPPNSSALTDEINEFIVGGRVLPWAGAAGFLIGMVTLVTMAITRGWIGPLTQFGLAATVCVILIGFGLRAPREQFIGQLVTGLGVCGSYLTLAGGYSTWSLFGSEILVGSYLALSLAVLGLGWRRESKLWVTVGVVGGTIAALMPLDRKDLGAAMLINAAIFVPASIVAWRRQWTAISLFITSAAVGVAMLIAGSPRVSDMYWGVPVTYLLVCALVGVAFVVDGPEDRSNEQFPLVLSIAITVLTAVVARGTQTDSIVSLPLWSYCLGVIVIARLRRPGVFPRAWLLGTGLLLAFLFVPYVFTPPVKFLMHLVACLGAFGVACRIRSQLVLAGGYVGFIAASLSFLSNFSMGTPQFIGGEALSVGALLAAIALGTWAALQHEFEGDVTGLAAWVGAIVAWILVSRLGDLAANSTGISMAWAVYGVMLIPLGFALGNRSLRYVAFVVLAMTLSKVIMIDLSEVDAAIRVAILIPLSLVLIGLSYVFYWSPRARKL